MKNKNQFKNILAVLLILLGIQLYHVINLETYNHKQSRRSLKLISHIESVSEQTLPDFSSAQYVQMGNQDQNTVIVSSANKKSSLFYIYSYPVVFSPILLFSSKETGIANNIIVSEDFSKLFVVSESDGLIIYDIQDIKNPVKKENLNFGDNHIYAAYYNSKSMAAIIEINTGIEIVSISSTYNYIFLGEITYNNFQPVSVAFSQNGDYLFVLDELLNQVLIFDISNLPSYTLVKSINLEYSPYQIEVRDKYAYLAAGYQGVIILDIQNMNNAQIIGQVQLPTIATFVTYIDEDDLLIASDLEYGLQIIQWDDIQYPIIINQADTLDKCYQVVQEKNSQDFYVASGTAGIQGFRLKFSQTEQVIDTLTQNIPYHRIIKEIDIQNLSYTYITQNAQYLFAVSTDGEFYSYNNSDKNSPVLSKQIAIGGIPKEIIVSISKNYAYVTCDNGLAIINISTPSNPTLTKYQQFTESGLISAIQKSEKYLIFIQEEVGILIYDITSFSSIFQVSSLELGDPRQGVISSSGTYLYVADRIQGLVVINLDSIASPSKIFSNQVLGESIQIFQNQKRIYLGVSYLGLQVYDISNPSNPQIIVNEIPNYKGQEVKNIYVSNGQDQAYIVDSSKGLQIINIKDLKNITISEQITTLGQPLFFQTNQNVKYGYITNEQKGIQILRLLSPLNINFLFPLDPTQDTDTPDMESINGIPIGYNRDALLFIFEYDETDQIYYSVIKEYKILQVKTYTGIKGTKYQYDSLPSWIQVNYEFGFLTITTETSPWSLGNLYLYTVTTYRVPDNAFIGLTDGSGLTIDTLEKSQQILINLFIYGYVDNQSYLTSKYNPYELEFQFYFDSAYETITDQIQEVINKNYYVEAIGQLKIINSLDVFEANGILNLVSNSLKTIRFFIYIRDGEDCIIIPNQQLPSTYIQTPDYKQIHMAGGTIDLNKSLQRIQIDIDQKSSQTTCIADIQVDDELDEEFNSYNVDLAKVLLVNTAPQLISQGLSLQNQYNEKFINSYPQIGKSYIFQLKQLFEDNDLYNSEDLQYSFQVYDANGNEDLTQNFIQFDELNFNFVIEPKPENMDNSYVIRLIVSDGFKTNSDEFVVEIINYSPEVKIKLQNQVQSAFINDKFIFQFDQNTFFDVEGDQLSYNIDSNIPSWLEFKEVERKFEGTPKTFQTVEVKITATDPYGKSVSDSFKIKVEPSFYYYFSILITYFIPIIGALGFIKYKDELYAICCYRKYEYKRPIEITVGEKLSYNIPMIKYELTIGVHLLKILLQNKNKKLQEQLLQEQSLQNYYYYFDQIQQQVKNKNVLAYIQEHPYYQNDENKNTISHIFDGLLNKFRLDNNKVASKLFQELKYYCQQQIIVNDNKQQHSYHDWYKELIVTNNSQVISEIFNSEYQKPENEDELEKELAQMEKIQNDYNKINETQQKYDKCDQSQDYLNIQALNSPEQPKLTQLEENSNQKQNTNNGEQLQQQPEKFNSNKQQKSQIGLKFMDSNNVNNTTEIKNANSQKNKTLGQMNIETSNFQDINKFNKKSSIIAGRNQNDVERENIQKLSDFYKNKAISKTFLQQQLNSNNLLHERQLSKFPEIQLDEEKIVSILNSVLILNQQIKLKLEKYEKNRYSQFKTRKSSIKYPELHLANKQTKSQSSSNNIDSNKQNQQTSQKNALNINTNLMSEQNALANTNRPINLSNIQEEMTRSVDDFEKDMEFIKQLIIQNIISEIRGIRKQKFFYGSRGESLHINPTQLLGVKGCQKVNPKDSKFSLIKSKLSFLKLDYEHLSSSNVNKILPDWIIDTCRFGVVRLYGIPAESDIGEFKIQILDKQNYILKEIWIKILPRQDTQQSKFQVTKQQLQSNPNIQQAQNQINHIFQRDKYKRYSFMNKKNSLSFQKNLNIDPKKYNQNTQQNNSFKNNQSMADQPSYIKNCDISVDFLNTDNKKPSQQIQQFMTPIPVEYSNINPIKKQKFKNLDYNQILSPNESMRSQGNLNLTQP